jgi:hypothetical protein
MANPEHLDRLLSGVEAWNTWRTQDNVVVDLSGANLAKAELPGADLWGAHLHRVTFHGANLAGAKFAQARLAGSNFFAAHLAQADFSHAALDLVTFVEANLTSARFTKAELGYTVFSQTILKGAIGLETCRHLARSSVDFGTLQRSGMLPEAFLRGCGLSNEFIQHVRSVLQQPTEFYSCFISYNHKDKAFADLLYDRLQAGGVYCYLDKHQLLPGDDLHEGIDRGIRLWDKVLLCCSKSSLHDSWWVDGEINRAFQKEAQIMKERGKKVLALIPLNLDGFLFGADCQSGKKAEITSRVAADFVGWEKDHALFDRELEKVIRALRTGGGGREKPPPAKL